jgi:predicted aspartyl protease
MATPNPSSPQPAPKSLTTPTLLRLAGPRPIVTATLRNPAQDESGPTLTVPFVVDTGAQTSVVELNCAKRLHLPRIRAGNVMGVTGSQPAQMTIADIKIGGNWYRSPFIVPPYQGANCLLGINLILTLHLVRFNPAFGIVPEQRATPEPNCPTP